MADKQIKFKDERTGRHGAFGDHVKPGVYNVRARHVGIAQGCVDAGIAEWIKDQPAKSSARAGVRADNIAEPDAAGAKE